MRRTLGADGTHRGRAADRRGDGGVRVELAPTQGEQVLVNQDLHADNVLAAEREPWLLIDPKPLAGEREFGVASIVRAPGARAQPRAPCCDASTGHRGARARPGAGAIVVDGAHGRVGLRRRRPAARATSRRPRGCSTRDDGGVEPLTGHLLISNSNLVRPELPSHRRADRAPRRRGRRRRRAEPVARRDGPRGGAAAGRPGRSRGAGPRRGPVEPASIVVLADFLDPSRAELLAVGSIGFLPPESGDDIGEPRSAVRASSRATRGGVPASSSPSSTRRAG